jgi:putative transposase
MMEKLASAHTVQRMCQAFQVSRSGYYKYINKGKQNKRNKEKLLLALEVMNLWIKSRRLYGSPRITAALRKMGYKVNRKRVMRLMHINNIKARRKKKYRSTTNSKHKRPVAMNLLMRNFTAEAPNKIWLGDITYLKTKEGRLYLAMVLDLYSRMPVGYNIQHHMRVPLVVGALQKAIETRGIPEKLIFHSDRGGQYASEDFTELLSKYKITQSMSRKANPYDNAPMESFFRTLKEELLNLESFNTRYEAKYAIINYIEKFYINQRLHSSLNYKSPKEFELSTVMA